MYNNINIMKRMTTKLIDVDSLDLKLFRRHMLELTKEVHSTSMDEASERIHSFTKIRITNNC